MHPRLDRSQFKVKLQRLQLKKLQRLNAEKISAIIERDKKGSRMRTVSSSPATALPVALPGHESHQSQMQHQSMPGLAIRAFSPTKAEEIVSALEPPSVLGTMEAGVSR